MSVSPTEEDVVYRVPVAMLMEMGDPVYSDIWGCGITWAAIEEAHAEGRFHTEPVGASSTDPHVHAARIAYLAANGWDDPIVFSTNEYQSEWPVLDGNHRLAAAALLEMEDILVSPDGDLDLADEIFGPSAITAWRASLEKYPEADPPEI